MTFDIFVSHRSDDLSLAENLRYNIERLSEGKIQVHVCHKIQGGQDWRDWIHQTIPVSKVFLFLYTGASADWMWCIFEAGLYRGATIGDEGNLICLKTSGSGDPPSPISDLQAYDVDDVRRLLKELIVEGKFNDGGPVNKDLMSSRQEELNEAIGEIETLLRQEHRDINYFSRRITISPKSTSVPVSTSFLSGATIEGEEHTFAILGLYGLSAKWEQLKANFQSDFSPCWVEELERSVDAMLPEGRSAGSGAKQVMSPFVGLDLGYTFLPVLSRVEKIDDRPRLISIIFIPMPSIAEHSAEMELHAVPPRITAIIRMLNMARRARWEVLIPFFESIENLQYRPQLDQEARLGAMRQEFGRFVRHLNALEEEAEKANFKNPTYARALLEVNTKDIVPGLWFEYDEAKKDVVEGEGSGDIARVRDGVGRILDINKKFLCFGLEFYLDEMKRMDWIAEPGVASSDGNNGRR